MKKAILFGATGNLGREVAKELVKQNYLLTVVIRDQAQADLFSGLAAKQTVADVTRVDTLQNICVGHDIVISSLGKSVSPNDNSKPSFYEIDYLANINILNEALKSGVEKFVYISALHSEKYPNLEYFKVHHDFSEKLRISGIDYSIIKPPALFSAYLDMIPMARKGRLISIGAGTKQTNPIYEGDLAVICVNSINDSNSIIEAGGVNLYSRKELLEIIQNAVNPNKKINSVPLSIFKFTLPLIRVYNKNMFDKFAFFKEVMVHDTIAPLKVGVTRFEDYIQSKSKDYL